jgi:hypothetical protein
MKMLMISNSTKKHVIWYSMLIPMGMGFQIIALAIHWMI